MNIAESTSAASDAINQIANLMRREGTGLTPHEISEWGGLPIARVRVALRTMEREGTAARNANGYWVVAECIAFALEKEAGHEHSRNSADTTSGAS